MKMSNIYLILGCLILFGSLLVLYSTPESPFAPLTASLGMIFIMWGVWGMKKFQKTIVFLAFSTVTLILGVALACYNISMQINEEPRGLYYIYIGIFTLMMFLIIYGFTRRLKNLNKSLNE